MAAIEFWLNDRAVRVDNPPPQMTLLEFIRSRGLTGAKEGCAEGECGACAVAVLEPDLSTGHPRAEPRLRSAYRAINSCLVFLPMAAGREILTVEALAADGELLDVQRAMSAEGGSQCGYCTPGFVVSLFTEHYRPDRTGPCDIMAMAGNLCRCTGYRPIGDAARALGPAPDDRFRARLAHPAPGPTAFAVPGFSRPTTLGECLHILHDHPEARVVAGATDLAVESNLFSRRWDQLVSLDSIDELHEFSITPEQIKIGAAVPLGEIARRWSDAPPAFGEWLTLFASPLIRNRATLGGNLATASPIGDAAPLLLALDAVVHVAGLTGGRAIPLDSFFTGYRRTALGAGEIITSITIPTSSPSDVRFYKVAKRTLDDISTVAAGIAVDRDENGRVSRARFAFGGVAATPLRVIEAEEAILGQPWNEAAVERIQRIFDRTLEPISDHRGSGEYRLEISKRLVEKYEWELRQ